MGLSKEVIFPELTIPKEEVGYLVIHFASALLRAQTQLHFNALVICSSGIGTSKILASKLEREFPEISRIKNISMFELDQMNLKDYQVVISTIPLKNYQGNYILVSPILSKDEIRKIKQFIWDQSHLPNLQMVKQAAVHSNHGVNAFNYLQATQSYLAPILTLLERFELADIPTIFKTETALVYACNKLVTENIVSEASVLVKQLLDREQVGSLGIPGTTLGLYHIRSTYVLAPSFTMYQVGQPILIKAMDGSMIELTRILLMIAPENPSGETLEVLSHISSLIIKDEASTQLFESKDEEAIFSFLAKNFSEFLDNKTMELRRG